MDKGQMSSIKMSHQESIVRENHGGEQSPYSVDRKRADKEIHED
jgi:hypothetical protein